MLVIEMTATKQMNLGASLKVNETKYPNISKFPKFKRIRRSNIPVTIYYFR